MPWKMLTATTTIIAQQTATASVIAEQTLAETTARATALEQAVRLAQTPAIQFLNVQRLMAIMKVIQITQRLPYLPQPERKEIINAVAVPPFEEEELLIKRVIPHKELQKQRTTRRQLTRLEKRLIEVQERLLSPHAIVLTDHQAFCLLEKYLWDNLRTETQQILEQLVEMCEKKAWYIKPIEGLEHLQKLMLQQYITAFNEMPYMMNMLALRLTQLTKQALINKSMSIYIQGATQAQAIKQKQQLKSCQARKLITKSVASGKPRKEEFPTKTFTEHIWGYDPNMKIGLWKDLKGKEYFFLALRYAFNMPFWLRRFFARQAGMPENHKYAGYFGIGVIPTRRTRFKAKKERYPEFYFTPYSRNQYLKDIKKYGSRYRAGYGH